MDRRYFLARLRGAAASAPIVLPDLGDPAQVARRAAELLSHVNGRVVRPEDVELAPYRPDPQQADRAKAG
ncbi:hypothetical protein ACFODL_09620 [Phenylobacterium terrae]|uniref:Uncharacterized protein n=1 Tax=Phenylobacterium terrae TaxID=2665495 RepID=A0ABW4N5Y6_9CAUL